MQTYNMYLDGRLRSFCKKYDLHHSYFIDPDYANETYGKRLRLDGLSEISCSENDSIPGYRFEYVNNNSSFAPNRLSNRIDHWGYFNDESDNDQLESLAPYTEIGSIKYGFAKRETKENAVKVASLQKIIYPTGGFTTYDVESNKVWDDESDRNRPVGGIRIKKIVNVDALSNGSVVREFKYNEPESNQSSGKLFIEPKYGYSYQIKPPKEDKDRLPEVIQEKIVAMPTVPLGDFNGIHVMYENVEELFTDEGAIKGSIQYNNNINVAPLEYSLDYFHPAPPYIMDPRHGTLRDKSTKSEFGNTLDFFSNDISFSTSIIGGPTAFGTKSDFTPVECQDGLGTPVYTHTAEYELESLFYRVAQTTAIRDGVETKTNYEFDSGTINNQNAPFSPTAITFTNSDGKVHRKEIKYAFDLPSENCMVEKNMLEIPIEERNFVDGVFQGGWRVDYSLSNNGQCKPRTQYELLNDWNGLLNDWTPYWRFRVLEYDNKGNPQRIQKRGYEPETLIWNDNHLLEQKDWNNWTWEWDYFDGSRMLKKYTDIDEQETNYFYDDLSRLDLVTERDGNVQTDFTYSYQIDNTALNSVRTEIIYADAESISTTQYLDGLGRDIQTVKCGYSPENNDIYTTYTYDGLGRMSKETQPIEGSSTCDYYSSDTDGDYWETVFEESPLNRPIFNRLSSWPAGTGILYGCNEAADAVKIYEDGCGTSSGGVYETCSLYKTTNIDENGEIAEVYTDKLGRQILVRKFLGRSYDAPFSVAPDEDIAPASTGAVEKVDTYTVYDDRGNIALIISPEAASDEIGDLNYCYDYDEVNRVVRKDLPGAAATTYGYYDNDLLKWETDAKGNTINYEYDEYGRLIKKHLGGTFSEDDKVEGGSLLMEEVYFPENSENTFKSQLRNSKVATVSGENNIGNLLTTDFLKYDEYLRLEESLSSNIIGGSDLYTFTYDSHADNISQIQRDHEGYKNIYITEDFTFDHSFRQKTHTYNSSLIEGSRQLSSNKYTYKDELDSKTIGGALMDYKYNTRSWLTGINTIGSGHEWIENECMPGEPFSLDLEIEHCIIEHEDPEDPDTPIPFPDGGENFTKTVYEIVNCDSLSNDCPTDDAAINQMQQQINDFISFASTISPSEMEYPQSLYRIRFCNDQEVYITDSHILLAELNGFSVPSNVNLQVICVDDEEEYFNVFWELSSSTKNTFGNAMREQNKGNKVNFEFYPECNEEDNCNVTKVYEPINMKIYDCERGYPSVPHGTDSTYCHGIFPEGVLNDLFSGECYGSSEFSRCFSFIQHPPCEDAVVDSVKLGFFVETGYAGYNESCGSITLEDNRVIELEGDTLKYIEIIMSEYDESVCLQLPALICTTNYCIYDITQTVYYSCECPDEVCLDCSPPVCSCPIDAIPNPVCSTCDPPGLAVEQDEYLEDLIEWSESIQYSNEIDFPILMCRVTLCSGTEVSIPTQYLEEHPIPGIVGDPVCDSETTIASPPAVCTPQNFDFGFVLSYDNPNTSYTGDMPLVPQYNGNISQMEYQVLKKDIEAYNYSYDNLDRLTNADYWWKSCENQYWNNRFYNVENITYDLNGNMETIKRHTKPFQVCDPSTGIIDDLAMSYSGNQLTSVSEGATLLPELGYVMGDHNGAYKYDANGNMTTIGNKSFTLSYNFLNLPGGMSYESGGSGTGLANDSWVYSADGTKLKYNGRDYIDGIEYENGKLSCIHHAEGRIFPKKQTDEEIANNASLEWEHNFYWRDHLGNTRVVTDGTGIIPIQENNYYPFGMNMDNIDIVPDNGERDSRYTYNGKEMNEDIGWLDYGARFYDPAIARWNSVDPLAEKYYPVSSYAYVANNPLKFIDPDGRSIVNPYEEFKEFADTEKTLKDKIKNATTKKAKREARKELRSQRANIAGFNSYKAVDDVIQAFKGLNENEFNRVDGLELNNTEIDVTVTLNNGRGADGQTGDTKFSFSEFTLIQPQDGGDNFMLPTKISGDNINVVLFNDGVNVNTLANEFGDAIFGVENPKTASEDIINKVHRHRQSATAFSHAYEQFILKGGKKPDPQDF